MPKGYSIIGIEKKPSMDIKVKRYQPRGLSFFSRMALRERINKKNRHIRVYPRASVEYSIRIEEEAVIAAAKSAECLL